MYFSGKITYSVIQFLVQRGKSFEDIVELVDLPTEYLREPTSWMEARKVEEFLKVIEKNYFADFQSNNLIEDIGHCAGELKAWGVLDSVLRMMRNPQDIFAQPQRFISYFISPPPPIANLINSETGTSFDLPMSHDEFPYVTTFLRSAIEALPTFMGKPLAEASWRNTKLVVSWVIDLEQESFFGSSDQGNIHPEFMHSLVATLESTEKALAQRKQELTEKEEQLIKIKLENEKAAKSLMEKTSGVNKTSLKKLEKPLHETRENLLKLSDYLTRSHQLITLLVGQDRMNAQVREAMRRVDWELIKNEYPKLVEQGMARIDDVDKILGSFDIPTPVTHSMSVTGYVQSELSGILSHLNQ